MMTTGSWRTMSLWVLVAMATVLMPRSGTLRAQEVPAEIVKPSTASSSAYSAAELRGRALFIANCSYCHLARNDNNKNPEPGQSIGPSLKGRLGGAKPMPEAVVRGFIQKGTPRMPGFQYSFTAAELDSLIAFLKTH
jgi:mono/diheme cytochrome c family protein